MFKLFLLVTLGLAVMTSPLPTSPRQQPRIQCVPELKS